MNGVAFNTGRRYAVSDLDIAILTDLMRGLVTAVPKPGTLQLLAAGLTVCLLRRRRRERDAA